ncbi:hypothetical protein FJTKL_03508 [Diaporthe vaccinii]|uniref:Protein kinase domain-containing protein n=1 Tax=Diaporthe vaccinii TaxID=105482 RepID=A0ABR4F2E7_9PEZI
MANPQGLDDLSKFVLQQTIDYFDNFWKTLEVWEPYERVSIFERLRIPYWNPARPDPAFDENQQAAVTAAGGRNVPFHRVTRSDAAGGDAVEQRMRIFFEESGYTFVKVLGAGSQGVAALFEFAGQRVVTKWSQELAALSTEMWAMRKMVGARHIVQVSESFPSSQTFWSARLKVGLVSCGWVLMLYNTQRKWRPGMIETDWDEDSDMMDRILTLEDPHDQELRDELGPGIPLMGLLRKISQQEAYLKDSDIWRVFLCLFRACVALSYPDKWAPEGFVPTRNVDAPTKEEFVPRNAAGAALPTDLGIIDFDMNDRNVMIGDFSTDPGPEHPHDQVPVAKVGDLGVITRLLPRHRDSFFVMVSGRLRGNMWYHFPEQFTETWKNVDGMDSLAADEVAGKYGWTSILWQVGRLMTIMITRVTPDVPPTCTQSEITKPDGTTQKICTYSGHLLGEQFNHYDPLLRSTVAWCMAHRPTDRPGILELERLITDAVAVDRSATEAEGRVSIRELLEAPPAVTTQVPSAVQDPPAAPPAPAAAGTAGPSGPTAPGGRGEPMWAGHVLMGFAFEVTVGWGNVSMIESQTHAFCRI